MARADICHLNRAGFVFTVNSAGEKIPHEIPNQMLFYITFVYLLEGEQSKTTFPCTDSQE